MTEEKKETNQAKVIDVPTQMGQVIELEDGSQVGILETIVLIYNKVSKLERLMG